MKERPILLNDAMVRAVLEGNKTQTRRVVNRIAMLGPVTEFQRSDTPGYDWIMRDSRMRWNDLRHSELLERCPYGQPGDRLWVREASFDTEPFKHAPIFADRESRIAYRATGDIIGCHKWRPSIHMHRWASRITPEVTGVRVERLQDISEQDAKAEGLTALTKDGHLIKYGIPDADGLPGNDDDGWPWSEWETDPRKAFQKLWSSIYGAESWNANPWVWAIEFPRWAA